MKGGRRRHTRRRQNESKRSPTTSQHSRLSETTEASRSGSPETLLKRDDIHGDREEPLQEDNIASSFANSTLSPSASRLLIVWIAWLFSILSWPLASSWEWTENMALGMARLWGTNKTEEAIQMLETSSEGSTKVKRQRRRRVAPGDAHFFPGMVNLSGVLCYMNSVLQSLASVSSLITHLERIHQLAVEADVPTPVSDALAEVLLDLNTPGPSQPPPLRPHALIAALQPLDQVRRLLATREQQDAHELFVVLAEAISDEAVKVAAEVVQLRGLADLVSLQAYCYLKGEKLPSPAPSTPSSLSVDRKPGRDKRKRAKGLAQPWEGLIARRRVCRRCGYHGEVRMDTLGGMELPVPISGDVRLESCIAEYLSPELLSGVTCEFCSLRATVDFYRSEASRLALPPNQAHLNGHSTSHSTPSGSFSALEHLPDPDASGDMSDRRRKKAKEAKKIEVRLEEMLESSVVSGFGDPILSPGPSGGAGLPVKWQKVNSDSVRETVITRPPQSLRLHIARSGISPFGQMIKKGARVEIPMILDMTRFTARGVWEERTDIRSLLAAGLKPTDKVTRVLYRLESVILHYGYSTSSGHFICIRRKPVMSSDGQTFHPTRAVKSCPDGCTCEDCVYFGQVREQNIPGQGWLSISDDDVEEVGPEVVVQASAAVFMLFYEKVGEYETPLESLEIGSTIAGTSQSSAQSIVDGSIR